MVAKSGSLTFSSRSTGVEIKVLRLRTLASQAIKADGMGKAPSCSAKSTFHIVHHDPYTKGKQLNAKESMAKKKKAKEQKQTTISSRTRDATTKGSTASFEKTGSKVQDEKVSAQ